MSADPVVTKVHDVEGGSILEIAINRPEAHNAVNAPAARLLAAAWQQFRDDDSLTVAILRGEGDQAFCAGADLFGLEGLGEISRAMIGPMGGTRIVQTKPVITVSQGFTYAGGLELFCHGHLRVAEPAATFSVACRRWGVPLVDGGTVYLPRLLGWGHALPLIITGQKIDAERAERIGLVWELAPKGEGAARAFDIALQLCRFPRDAMFADLASAIRGFPLPLDEALEVEAANLEPVTSSESMRIGVKRFQAGERFWFK